MLKRQLNFTCTWHEITVAILKTQNMILYSLNNQSAKLSCRMKTFNIIGSLDINNKRYDDDV